jgi:hypothetical protein
LDEVYRGHRITITERDDGCFTARITHVRGQRLALTARASATEGEEACFIRARAEIDRYLSFLSDRSRSEA